MTLLSSVRIQQITSKQCACIRKHVAEGTLAYQECCKDVDQLFCPGFLLCSSLRFHILSYTFIFFHFLSYSQEFIPPPFFSSAKVAVSHLALDMLRDWHLEKVYA
jgi:hypothetical protein